MKENGYKKTEFSVFLILSEFPGFFPVGKIIFISQTVLCFPDAWGP